MRFSFLLLGALVSLLKEPGLVAGFCTACVLHEAGHVIAARLTGGRISLVELRGSGILMTVSRDCLAGTAGELLVLLSGPAVNLLTAGILYLLGSRGALFLLSLWEGGLNLLPFSGLDGGAALELLVRGRPDEYILLRRINVLRWGTAGAIAAMAVWRCC